MISITGKLKRQERIVYSKRPRIIFWISVISFIILLLSSIFTQILPWTIKLFDKPSRAISTQVCTTLKQSDISYQTSSGKKLTVDTKLLNNGHLLIKNSGKNDLQNVGVTVNFHSEKPLTFEYIDIYATSAGLLQNITKPSINLKDHSITFSINYINPNEIILMDFGLDRPADGYTEVRGEGLTSQQTTLPGCKNFSDLQKVENSSLFGSAGLTYFGPDCKLSPDNSMTCTLISESDQFSIPKDAKPGSVLQEKDEIDQDRDPIQR